MKIYLPLFLIITLLFSPFLLAADNDIEVLPQYQYIPSDNVSREVETARQDAINSEKLLLLVLGAQWCHDSRGLSQQFSSPALHNTISERFETVFVDVGYYKDYRHLTQEFGYPGYFATPSVMVIEPHSRQLLNMQTMPIWNAAHSVSSEDYLQYFSTIGQSSDQNEGPLTATQQQRVSAVNDFANQQTARLFKGFSVISPLLKGAVEDTLDDFTVLQAVSDEAHEFRMQLQKDIHALHISALENQQPLSFPNYGPFSWEAK